MLQTQTDHWKDVLAVVEKKVGPHKLSLWLTNSVLLSCEPQNTEQVCTVGLPNLFICEWVAQHFTQAIAEGLQEVFGVPTTVHFRVDPELLAESRHLRETGRKVLEKSERARKSGSSGLKGSYTFDSFVPCPANHLAYQATRDAVADLGNTYNPLFLYGGVGLGKTHLIQAALKEARAQRSNFKSLYVSCDQFVNQFIVSMKSGALTQFRARYRELDLLVIDDIHILSKKDATQSEFLHTFNELQTAGSQIILASDSHPKLLKRLTRQLIDRFVCGMVVKLDTPGLAARIQILESKAQRLGKTFEPGVLEKIARSAAANVRELEGALTRVIAFEAVSGTPVTQRLVEEILGEGFEPKTKGVTLKDVETRICSNFRVTSVALKAAGRKKSVALPRQIAMYLSRELTNHSLSEIGNYYGGRTHSTVMFACKQIAKTAQEDGQIRRVLNNLKSAIFGEA